jgi:hypothetical protein
VFTEALRELGWVEGENIVFDRRYAENRLERVTAKWINGRRGEDRCW